MLVFSRWSLLFATRILKKLPLCKNLLHQTTRFFFQVSAAWSRILAFATAMSGAGLGCSTPLQWQWQQCKMRECRWQQCLSLKGLGFAASQKRNSPDHFACFEHFDSTECVTFLRLRSHSVCGQANLRLVDNAMC